MPVVRATVAGIIPAALLLAACGSSSSGIAAASAAASNHPVPAADICVQVADVLSNGPDPDVDPVGYAEAQYGPLGAVKANKPGLQAALRQLSTAYQQEFTQGVTRQTKSAVKAGQRAIHSLCPGAAS